MIGTSGFPRILRALSNPNYGIYTAGSAVSLVGTWMQRVAVGWLTWQLTESGAWLGAMAFADLFPTVIVGPLAGALADRWDRLRVTKVSQALAMVQSLLLFGLTVSGLMTVELLLVLTVALGIIAAVNQPARLAMIPEMVPAEDLPAAVAINSIIFNSARFIGPLVSGVAIVSLGVSGAFAANAATFVFFLLALTRVRLTRPAVAVARKGGLIGDIGEGIGYAARHAGIAPLLLLMIVLCICTRPFVELLPGFADEVFGAGATGLALLTATVGIGATVGGLWLAQREGSRGLTLLGLLATLVLCLALLLFVATDSLWVAVPALAVAGFCMVATGVGMQILMQLSVESAMRGRVMSLYGLIFRGGPAIGALIMGGASEAVGLRWPLAAGVLLALAATAWIWTRRQRMTAALEGGTPAERSAAA